MDSVKRNKMMFPGSQFESVHATQTGNSGSSVKDRFANRKPTWACSLTTAGCSQKQTSKATEYAGPATPHALLSRFSFAFALWEIDLRALPRGLEIALSKPGSRTSPSG
jgi:hypothetical protein